VSKRRGGQRRHADAQRIAEAVSFPDGHRWEPEYGWVLEVQFYGGDLDQVGDVPCRVLSSGPPGDGFGEYLPPVISAEVLVGITGGDPETDPVVLGFLSNAADGKPPTEINGRPIVADLEFSGGVDGDVSPFDTEIKRSPFNRREQYDGDTVHQARQVIIRGDERVQLLAEQGAKIELVARGSSSIEVRHEGSGAIRIDGPDIRIADGAAPIARVGDLIQGSINALVVSGTPGTPVPLLPVPPALPTTSGGVSFVAKIVTGGRAKG
jgi:hypothetical protein